MSALTRDVRQSYVVRFCRRREVVLAEIKGAN
jgi:hypothetical protein